MDLDGGKRVFNRLGPSSSSSHQNHNQNQNQKVCYHWRAGNCNRHPCPFLHRELSAPPVNGTTSSKRGFSTDDQYQRPNNNNNNSVRRGGFSSWGPRGGGRGNGPNNNNGNNRVVVKQEKICNYWMQGKCSYGDTCRFLHSWSTGSFGMLTHLEGHQKIVSGIAFPVGSDKLYTGSKDETVRVWDCQSGQCVGVIPVGGEVGCMLSEGPWMFVGLPNLVKAWNMQNSAELTLNGPVGQVYSLVAGNDLLLAGTQDGSILAWKYNTVTSNFEPAAALQGHTSAVVSLVVGGVKRLYSGSMDNSIKVWNLENLQCLQTLTDHTSVVIFGWLIVVETWKLLTRILEEHGLLTLCGMHDLESKPVLLCSCNDNSVRAYDLPTFAERGKIFAKQEIRSIHGGPNIFFTGDGTGEVRV